MMRSNLAAKGLQQPLARARDSHEARRESLPLRTAHRQEALYQLV